jgi:hypothetical protein
MGIVKISDLMHENLRLASNALSRSINAQAEHWLKIGMLSELYPHLTHQELTRLLKSLRAAWISIGWLTMSRCHYTWSMKPDDEHQIALSARD